MARGGLVRQLLAVSLLLAIIFIINVLMVVQKWPSLPGPDENQDPYSIDGHLRRVRTRLAGKGGNESLILEKLEKRLLLEQEVCGRNSKPGILLALEKKKNLNSSKLLWTSKCEGLDPETTQVTVSPSYSVIISVLVDSTKCKPRNLAVDVYRVLLDSAVSDVHIVINHATHAKLAKDAEYGQRLINWDKKKEEKLKLVVEDDVWTGWSKVEPYSEGVVMINHLGEPSSFESLNQVWHNWQHNPTTFHGLVVDASNDQSCPSLSVSVEAAVAIHSYYLCFLGHSLASPLRNGALSKAAIPANVEASLTSWMTMILWLGRITGLESVPSVDFHRPKLLKARQALNMSLPNTVMEYIG